MTAGTSQPSMRRRFLRLLSPPGADVCSNSQLLGDPHVPHKFKVFRKCGESIDLWAYAGLTHCDEKHWSFKRQCAKEDICPRELYCLLPCCVWCAKSRSLRWALRLTPVVALQWVPMSIQVVFQPLYLVDTPLGWDRMWIRVGEAKQYAGGNARDGVPSVFSQPTCGVG